MNLTEFFVDYLRVWNQLGKWLELGMCSKALWSSVPETGTGFTKIPLACVSRDLDFFLLVASAMKLGVQTWTSEENLSEVSELARQQVKIHTIVHP